MSGARESSNTWWRGRRFALLGLLLLGACRQAHGAAPAQLNPGIHAHTLKTGELERRYLVYVPKRLSSPAPLLVLLHGSRQSPEELRQVTAQSFERLADQHGFVAVYPAAHRRRWNDCRAAGRYPARRKEIDDVSFVLTLIDTLRGGAPGGAEIDPRRVFLAGYSNGGQLAFRVALERPERVAGIAVFAANLPTEENWYCRAAGRPVPALLIHGTADPISPFEGGEVDVFGFASRGTVRSSLASAEYFATLAGLSQPQRQLSASAPEQVERYRWSAPTAPEVMLVEVRGGGHVIPGPHADFPAILGSVDRSFDGAEEAWRFFARQPSAHP